MTKPGRDDATAGAGAPDDRSRVDRWDVVATSRFERDLGRLPPRVATAIVEYVTALLPRDPLRMTKVLTGQLQGFRAARRGDYRVIIRLDEDARVVILHRVAHRAHAYRPG